MKFLLALADFLFDGECWITRKLAGFGICEKHQHYRQSKEGTASDGKAGGS